MKTHVHMIGIGGIGMSALAQLYLSRGVVVTGSDRASSVVTELLVAKDIPIHIGHEHGIPKGTTEVVYSDAVPADNPERVQARSLGVPEHSYFQALGTVSRGADTIAVSGTHGKTTTTAMLTKILRDAGKEPSAVIGSLVTDFQGNFVHGTSNAFIVEACEYRDHVLELSPRILVITNIEWDHTDWFKTEEDMVLTFKKAARKVPSGGTIVANMQQRLIRTVLEGAVARVVDYSTEVTPELLLIGSFNKENAQAAKAAAKVFAPDLSETSIDTSLASFRGTWRRFERKGVMKVGALVFDDYAHHPTAIRETLLGVREAYPDKKIVLLFQPHLYTRTRDLFDAFVESLSLADEVVLAPIYGAREEPISDVTSHHIAAKISERGGRARALDTFADIETCVRQLVTSDTLVLTMGAGDIYKVADALIQS